jgi:hypothetical protein
MGGGRDTQDFSAIYEFTAGNQGKQWEPKSTANDEQGSETTGRKVA